MSAVSSTMLKLTTPAPDFCLPNVDGKMVSLKDFLGKPLLVIFMCNHCPFVKHLSSALAKLGRDYQPKGLGLVGISANNIVSHPEDHPDKMKIEAKTQGYSFPYLYDESQSVAKAYTAACTPDFFLFDAQHKLVYRGQFDASRPGGPIPVTGIDLKNAIDALLSHQPISNEQKPSIGCNIKWKPGNEPDYFLKTPKKNQNLFLKIINFLSGKTPRP